MFRHLSEDAQDDIDNIADIDEIGRETVDSGGVSIVYKDGATIEVNTGEKSGGTYSYTPVNLFRYNSQKLLLVNLVIKL